MRLSTLPVLIALTTSAALAQPPGGFPGGPPPGGFPGPARVALPAGTVAHRDIAYVPNGHPRQKLDLYLPERGVKLPLIIMVHGGAFMMGDKGGENTAEWLTRGYAVASLNYRLSQDAIFPAQIEDCKAAVRWLRKNAAKYRIDPKRFGAFGASAGGNLVALLGTAGSVKTFDVGQNRDVSSRVQAVADWFGPTDFLQMDAHRLPNGQMHDPADSPESRLIGGAIQENKTKVAKANPITYITKATPPFFIAHGDMDAMVPHHQSELLAVALKKAGVPVTFHTVRGAGHGFQDATTTAMTHAFFDKYLKAKGN